MQLKELKLMVSENLFVEAVRKRDSEPREGKAWRSAFGGFDESRTCTALAKLALSGVNAPMGNLLAEQLEHPSILWPTMFPLPATARPIVEAGAMHAFCASRRSFSPPSQVLDECLESHGALPAGIQELIWEVASSWVNDGNRAGPYSQSLVFAQLTADNEWSSARCMELGVSHLFAQEIAASGRSGILLAKRFQDPGDYMNKVGQLQSQATTVKEEALAAFSSLYSVGFFYYLSVAKN